MALSTGSRVQLAYVPEVTFGTTPVTPSMVVLPKQSISLDLAKEVFNDPTILSDRMERYERHGNYQVTGDIAVSLSHSQFDPLIEAATQGTWTTNVLKIGQTARSFTFEQGFLDIAQYRRFTGVRVNTFSLNVVPNAIVSATFGLIGSGFSSATSPLDASPDAVLNKQPLTHIGGTVTIEGSPVTCTAFTMSIDNQMSTNYAIGSSAALDVTSTESTVTGSVTFYLEDLVEYNRFVNETEAAIIITLTDGTDTITIELPRVKFNGGSLPVPDSGTLFVTMPFKALRDATDASTVVITRT